MKKKVREEAFKQLNVSEILFADATLEEFELISVTLISKSLQKRKFFTVAQRARKLSLAPTTCEFT